MWGRRAGRKPEVVPDPSLPRPGAPVRSIAAALAIAHYVPPTRDAATPSRTALTTGERSVRQAYVRRERARRLAHRRAALARTVVVAIPRQRTSGWSEPGVE